MLTSIYDTLRGGGGGGGGVGYHKGYPKNMSDVFYVYFVSWLSQLSLSILKSKQISPGR